MGNSFLNFLNWRCGRSGYWRQSLQALDPFAKMRALFEHLIDADRSGSHRSL